MNLDNLDAYALDHKQTERALLTVETWVTNLATLVENAKWLRARGYGSG